jgi:hypothetical protein
VSKHNFWVLIERAADIPNQWVAHCLELDVVTQGNNPNHTCEMLLEACAMVLLDGIDISERHAPEEVWDRLWEVVQQGSQEDWGKISEVLQKLGGVAAFQMMFPPVVGPKIAIYSRY